MRNDQENENESGRMIVFIAALNFTTLAFTHRMGTAAIILGGVISTAVAITGWYFIESWGDNHNG